MQMENGSLKLETDIKKAALKFSVLPVIILSKQVILFNAQS